MQIYITITATIQIHTCPITTKVDFSTNQEMPKTASKPPEARRQAWNRAFLPALEENHSCRYIDLGLLASRTETTHFSVLGTMSYVWEHGKKLEVGTSCHFWTRAIFLGGGQHAGRNSSNKDLPFLLLKSPSLWCFAALTNEYSRFYRTLLIRATVLKITSRDF